MKKLILFTIAALIAGLSFSQEKAFGPLNFGMKKNEVKAAIKASENMKLMGGQLMTELLGEKYFGTFVYNEDGMGLVGLWVHHYGGNIAAYNRNYNAYNTTDLEADINSLFQLLNEQYGQPIIDKGFVHPGSTETNRPATVAIWISGEKHIRLIERNMNSVVYPQIAIFDKTFMEKWGESIEEVTEQEKEKTKSMF